MPGMSAGWGLNAGSRAVGGALTVVSAAAVLTLGGVGFAGADQLVPAKPDLIAGPFEQVQSIDGTGLPGEPNYATRSGVPSIGPAYGYTVRVTSEKLPKAGLDPNNPPRGYWNQTVRINPKAPKVVGGWSKNVLPVNPATGKAEVGFLGTTQGEGGTLKVGFSRQYRVKIESATPINYLVVNKGGTNYLGIQYKFVYSVQYTTHGTVAGIPWGDLDPNQWQAADDTFIRSLFDQNVPIPSIK